MGANPTGAPAAPDPLLGQLLGGVRLQHCLNKSKLSAVYLGTLEKTGLQVAVKVFSPAWSRGGGMTPERFVREGRSLAQLDHPHIVKVYDIGEQGGFYFIVMHYLEGAQPLRLVADAARVPIPTVVQVGRSIANALAYIHAMGLVHRDVKPTNIHMSAEGRPILTDFSLVKVEGASQQLTQQGTILGTVNYMPPEQARPDGSYGPVGPPADIYALGATMFWMMTGEPPFKGRTPMETIIKLLKEDVPRPSKLRPDRAPPELEKLVLRMLAKKQSERPQSAQDVINELERIMPRMGVPGAPPAPVPPQAPARPAAPAAAPSAPQQRTPSSEFGAARGTPSPPVAPEPVSPVVPKPTAVTPRPRPKTGSAPRPVSDLSDFADASPAFAPSPAPMPAPPAPPPRPALSPAQAVAQQQPVVLPPGTRLCGPDQVPVPKFILVLLCVASLAGMLFTFILALLSFR